MTQNLRLVNYFISKFYDKNTLDLFHITSPTFTCRVNGFHSMTFEQYAARREKITQNATLEFIDLNAKDGTSFTGKLMVTTKKKECKAFGSCTLTVRNNLLEDIEMNYVPEAMSLSEYNNLLFAE